MLREMCGLSAKLLAGALILGLFPGCSCSGGEEPLADEPEQAEAPVEQPDPATQQAEAEQSEPDRVEEENPLPIDEEPEEPPAEDGAEETEPEQVEEPEEESFPLAAVAFQFVTDVAAEPRSGAPVIGYLRRGARVRVAEKVGTRGCSRGWYRIEGGGFVCHGKGVVVGENPDPWPDAPPQPDLESPLPYGYHGIVRDDVPEYWEQPTADMEKQAAAAIRRLRAASEPAPVAEDPGDSPDGGAGEETADGGPSAPEPEPEPEPEPDPAPAGDPDGGAEGDGGSERVLPTFVRLPLARGFIVSGSTIEGRWFRTVRGRYVERTFLTEREGPEFHGVELGPEDGLPMAFVVRGRAKALRPVQGPRLRLEAAGVLRRLSALPVLGELVRDDQTYLSIGRGLVARQDVLAVAEPVDRPPDVGPEDQWIDVDLSSQTLVAYEGDRPVYATVISSGREADGFGTPEGVFRIRTKHVSATMDDPDGGEEAYSIEDVPWTMYFQDSYALHGAFWHSNFGRQRSHGCVNLAPADARWLFFWAAPHLPAGWHGVRSTRANPGTVVVIHR